MKYLLIPPSLVMMSVILILLFYFFQPDYNVIPFPFNLAGLVVSYIGFTIMGKAREMFTAHKTSLGKEQPTWLIREGIFQKTRNPMYIGMFLLLLGIGICFRNIFSMLVPFVFLLIIMVHHVPIEEKELQNSFGDAYLEYKRQVKRWM
jgi:protein-S-isoprenylcysteine O-methyltransferase Ste14